MTRVTPTKRVLPAVAFTTAVLLAGCGGSASPEAEGFVELPVAFTLSPEPLFRIGDETGGPGTFETLGGVQVDGRGRIVVVDAGASEVRFFSSAGQHMATAGGPGEGPGEFGFPGLLGITAGDSVVVVDRQDQEVTVLGPDGSHGRSLPLMGPNQTRPLQAHGALRDGRLVVHFVEFFPQLQEGQVFGDTLILSVIDPVSDEGWRLGPGGSLTFLWTGELQVLLPFAPTASLDVAGDRVVSLDASGRAILVYRAPPEGGFRLEPPHGAAPVTAADREAYRQAVGPAGDDPRRQAALQALDHPRVPQRKPVYDQVKLTDSGGVWARRWGLGGEDRTWDVYAADGTLRGTVTTPAGLAVEDVSGDLVVGVRTDSLGVAAIEGYGLLPATGG